MRKHNWVVRTPNVDVQTYAYQSGTPLLIDDLNGFICEPVLFFLSEKYLSIYSPDEIANSLNAYAHDLKDWWIFMDEFQLRWDKIKAHHLESYCSVLRATKSPYTGLPFSTKTIKRRISTISEFYKWARISSLYKGEIEDDVLLDKLVEVPTIKLYERATEKHLPSILNPDQAKALMKSLGYLPSDLKDSSNHANSVFRLSAEIALNTGLRISEVVNLKWKQITSFGNIVEDTKAYKVTVVGKGNRVRKVNFPGWLLKELKLYSDFLEVIFKHDSESRPANLLLNSASKTQWSFKPLSVRSLQRSFSEACLKAHLTYHQFKDQIRHGSNKKSLTITKVEGERVEFTFHDLRHSFAVWTYYSRKKYDSEPWLYIQAQLGHAHLETTIGTYLKCTLEFEAEVSDVYMERLL